MVLNLIRFRLRSLVVPLAVVPLAWSATAASAIDLFYGVTVDVQSGSLAGQSLTGSLSFDGDDVPVTGFSEVDLKSFSFVFDGTEYTESDDPFAFAEFEDGSLSGLSYAVFDPSAFDPVFTFESFFGSQFFDYTDPTGVGADGSGDVTFTALTAPVDPVPEPSTVIGTGLMLFFAYLFYRQRQQTLAKASASNP